MRVIAAATVALALAGCAHAPEVTVVEPPLAQLQPGARLEIAGTDGEAGRAVAKALHVRGFRTVPAGEAADFLVQATFAEKPRAVGAFLPGGEEDPQWLGRGEAPRPWSLRRRAYVLNVAIIDRGGREVFHSLASQPFRKPAPEAALARLADAALAPLSVQSGATPGA